MSTCISRHGEYGEHILDDQHTCTRCSVLDEDALRGAQAHLRAELAKAQQSDHEARQQLAGNQGTIVGQRARIAKLAELARTVLNTFSYPGHPGRPCLQSGWIDVDVVRKWREAVDHVAAEQSTPDVSTEVGASAAGSNETGPNVEAARLTAAFAEDWPNRTAGQTAGEILAQLKNATPDTEPITFRHRLNPEVPLIAMPVARFEQAIRDFANQAADLASKETIRLLTEGPNDADKARDPELAADLKELNAKVTAGAVLSEIADERARQDAKWGEQNHPDGTGPAFRTFAESGRDRCQQAAADGELTWRDILREETGEAYAEQDAGALRTELIQVAAVAVAWIEAIDRRAAAGLGQAGEEVAELCGVSGGSGITCQRMPGHAGDHYHTHLTWPQAEEVARG